MKLRFRLVQMFSQTQKGLISTAKDNAVCFFLANNIQKALIQIRGNSWHIFGTLNPSQTLCFISSQDFTASKSAPSFLAVFCFDTVSAAACVLCYHAFSQKTHHFFVMPFIVSGSVFVCKFAQFFARLF